MLRAAEAPPRRRSPVKEPNNTPGAAGASRRQFLKGAGAGLTGLAFSGPLLSACAGSSSGGSGSTGTIKIGFVSPRTGATAGFGEPDGYVLQLARKAFSSGLTINGTKYTIVVVDKDSQSNPQRSAQVAQDLINSQAVDLMLTT